jgi:hypothetical protein
MIMAPKANQFVISIYPIRRYAQTFMTNIFKELTDNQLIKWRCGVSLSGVTIPHVNIYHRFYLIKFLHF